ncbi:thiol reductant ABC exporter subunit CydD [Oricola thermophila]|uniref:Thiol reductant ABC exporter subunit CydD n=1 Tax=Oricola thermophila TaxID=2742145 RepID=A0A6N1VCS6_9HYPH|nr:thiol reductant ABC exporter subunit CydD [Oricola thermophila]QKV17022.1 thiol reductant ABC exporter subunit CydD [Oricola thermophila]
MDERASKARAAARLDGMLAPDRRRLSAASWLTALTSLLWIPQAALVAGQLAALIADEDPFPGPLVASVAFFAIGILRAVLSSIAGGMAFAVADTTLSRERAKMLKEQARRSPVVAGRNSSAEIASLAADKLDLVAPYLTRYAPAMARTRVVPLAILAISFAVSWIVGVILLVAGPLIPVFMALVGMAARDASERQMQEIGGMNALLLERIQALTDLRLLDAVGRTVDDFEAAADRLRRQTMEVLRIAFLSSTVLELFAAIGVALVAVYVGFALIGELRFGAWATPLTAGEGIFLLLLAPDFFQPLRDLAAAWHDKASALAVAGEIAEMECGHEMPMLGAGASTAPLSGSARIVTRDLLWTTPGGRKIHFPDIRVEAGESLAITGRSGSGKTTLLALLAGLAPATDGKIEVAGVHLDDEIADAWRARLGWIGQAPHFFNESLRANLLLSAQDRDDARLSQAIAKASAEGIVAALPRGLDTQLGETGHGVSGGEARRLMIARALYSDADVVLADEPTADLDEATAKAVTEGLLALASRGTTLIVATHDMELAGRLDRIVELENAE